MNIKQLLGEVNGKDIIDIGDIVNVTTLKGREVYGRLNASDGKEIKVGMIRIKVDNIINIEKGKEKEKRKKERITKFIKLGNYK